MKLTQRFGPIPVATTLDGSGNGTVTFQPNGSNARITNLFVKVSTATAQATCTIYKGQVADGNAINTTNSGSTGAPASGAIDLVDGEVLYVVWQGGDAGATATATFTGITIPFDEVGPSQLEWADPIAAGDGSLVYPALKSPNYVAGVDGWKISRDGDAEFNDVTVRGTVEVDGNNSSFITIASPSGQPKISLMPENTVVGDTLQAASILAFTSPGVPEVDLIISSPEMVAGSGEQASVTLRSVSTVSKSQLILNAGRLDMTATHTDVRLVSNSGAVNLISLTGVNLTGSTTIDGIPALVGKRGSVTAGPSAATSFTVAVNFGVTFASIPNVHVNLNSGAGSTANWHGRAISISTTGFTLFGFGPSSTFNGSWQWTAVLES
jgi:hypothetical protein